MNLTPIADVKHKKNSGVHQYVVDYPRYCDLCNHDMKKLSNRFEFAQHLRALHSTREGGSFICRYGPNGVCQTLPLEGVSDHDYEAHIRKFHSTIAFAFGNQSTLSSTEEDAKYNSLDRSFTAQSAGSK